VEDRAPTPPESPCRAAGGLSKTFGTLIKHPALKRVVAFDEGRFGLKTWLRRRWCPRGERPPWIVQDAYAWLWLYAAVEPTTGTGVFLLLPTREGTCLELFLRQLRHELGQGQMGVVLDSSGSHRSAEVRWPQGMHPLYLPPSSPELTPAEQVFRPIRKHLSNTLFTTLDELQNALINELQQFWEHPTVLLQLTGSPWWVEAIESNISFLS
jgi:transposase